MLTNVQKPTAFKTDCESAFIDQMSDPKYGLLELTTTDSAVLDIRAQFQACFDIAQKNNRKHGDFFQFDANMPELDDTRDIRHVEPIRPIIERMMSYYKIAANKHPDSLRFQYDLVANIDHIGHVHHHYVVNFTSGDLGVCWNNAQGAQETAQEASFVLIKPFFSHYSLPMEDRVPGARRDSLILS